MTRGRRAARILGTGAALLGVVLGFVVVAGVVVIRSYVLDESLYNDALARADAYNRVYTDVLSDPELADVKEDMLGDIDLAGLDPATVRILTTNSLRWSLPPATLRTSTEAFIATTLAYIRGDTDRLDGDVELQSVVDNIDAVVVTQARAALAGVRENVTATTDQYRTAVVSFVDEFAVGRVPSSVPIAAASIPDADVAAVLLEELGVPVSDDLRATIEGAVLAGNEGDALITAITSVVDSFAAEDIRDLRGRLEDGHRFDVVGELADRADRSRDDVVDVLNTVRDLGAWPNPWTLALGIALMFGGLTGLVLLHRRLVVQACTVVAGALALAGVVVLGTWYAARQGDSPLHDATGTGAGSWNLSAGLRGLLRDVEENVIERLDEVVLRVALVPIVLAAILAIGVLIAAAVRSSHRERIVAVAGAAAVLGAVVVWFVAKPSSSSHTCNGHAELCERAYDEVVQVATHNSMSSPDVVQIWPEQDGTIREQLDAGVRALLIDTHYWPGVTAPDQLTGLEPTVPANVANRVFETGGDRLRPHDGVFLCHNNCALGGEPFADGLAQVHDFLVANPDEVVTLVVQDETSAADTTAEITEAGLEPFLYDHAARDDWPTFGELIDAGERLIVFAENEGPPPSWYRNAFDDMQDTPFGFPTPDAMTCERNRGADDAMLLLMNHWVSRVAPDRATAAVVNTHDFVVDRARECEKARGRLPNFVAVDFYSIGDVVGAVDTLNGFGSGSEDT